MIVFIEDNKIYSKALSNRMGKEGFNDFIIFEGIKDFKFIEADLYIVDIHLQEGLSFPLIKEIRKKSKSPIVILSNSIDQNSIIKSLEIGGDIHFDKLITPKIFIAKIKSIINMFNRLTK